MSEKEVILKEVVMHEIKSLEEKAKIMNDTVEYCKNALEPDCVLVMANDKAFAIYMHDILNAVKA